MSDATATAAAALDVGCGPGALTEVLSLRLGAGAVTAVDPSRPFVEAARERMPGVRVVEAPAEALPFADGTFGAAFAQLVVHFMADPAAGIAEMRRVTRPGGMVALNVWDFENHRAPQSLFFRALLEVMPDADDEVARAGARRGQLAELLSVAGCADVEQSELAVSIEFASFADWWEPYTLGWDRRERSSGVSMMGHGMWCAAGARNSSCRRIPHRRRRLGGEGHGLTVPVRWCASG